MPIPHGLWILQGFNRRLYDTKPQLPMPTNQTFMKAFANVEGNTDESKQQELQAKHKFGYQSGIGELIYPVIT
jgi:hypothetical protein